MVLILDDGVCPSCRKVVSEAPDGHKADSSPHADHVAVPPPVAPSRRAMERHGQRNKAFLFAALVGLGLYLCMRWTVAHFSDDGPIARRYLKEIGCTEAREVSDFLPLDLRRTFDLAVKHQDSSKSKEMRLSVDQQIIDRYGKATPDRSEILRVIEAWCRREQILERGLPTHDGDSSKDWERRLDSKPKPDPVHDAAILNEMSDKALENLLQDPDVGNSGPPKTK